MKHINRRIKYCDICNAPLVKPVGRRKRCGSVNVKNDCAWVAHQIRRGRLEKRRLSNKESCLLDKLDISYKIYRPMIGIDNHSKMLKDANLTYEDF